MGSKEETSTKRLVNERKNIIYNCDQQGPFWKLKSSDSSHEEVGDESTDESKSINIDTSKSKPPDIEKMVVTPEDKTQEQVVKNI